MQFIKKNCTYLGLSLSSETCKGVPMSDLQVALVLQQDSFAGNTRHLFEVTLLITVLCISYDIVLNFEKLSSFP